MIFLRFTCLLSTLAFSATVLADVPRKAPLTKYTGLWTNSPFTSKPPPPEAAAAVNPFEDYVLAGVSPIEGGYLVTLINKKEPDVRMAVQTGQQNPKEMKIVGVDRKPGDPLGTIVRLSSGAATGTVKFEPEFLALKAAPVQQANPQAQQGDQQNQQQRGQNPNARQPRPRVVPPPNPQGQQNQQQNQRPDRRRR